jgi:hypothetical protein
MPEEQENAVRTRKPDEEQKRQDGGGRFERIVGAVLTLCLVILAIQFGLWGYRRFGPPPSASSLTQNELAVGTQFPVVGSVDLGGNSVELPPAEPGTPATILVILTTTCPFCRLNVPIWNTIQRSLGSQVRFIALSLDDRERTQGFLEASRAEFSMLVVEDARSFVADLGLHAVPQTLALDADGVIQQIWGGGLSEDQVAGMLQSMVEIVPGLQLTH